jgi:hypothetical protein
MLRHDAQPGRRTGIGENPSTNTTDHNPLAHMALSEPRRRAAMQVTLAVVGCFMASLAANTFGIWRMEFASFSLFWDTLMRTRRQC